MKFWNEIGEEEARRMIEPRSDDLHELRSMWRTIQSRGRGVIDSFYQRIMSNPSIAAKFRDSEQVARLGEMQLRHLELFMTADRDESYRSRLAKIGEVHQEKGVSSDLYTAACAVLLDEILSASSEVPGAMGSDSSRRVTALTRAMLFDVCCVVGDYVVAERGKLISALGALREKEAQLVETQEIAQIGRWSLSLPQNFLSACDRASTLLGLDQPGASADGFAALRRRVAEEDREGLKAVTRRALRSGDTYEIRYAVVSEQGEKRFIKERARGILDDHGRPVRIVGGVQDVSSSIAQVERIRRLALFDELTGLANRASFYQRLGEVLLDSEISGERFHVVFIDLNRFKEVNDTEGHQVGDMVLVEIANRLRSVRGRALALSRLGGDEFVLILPDTTDVHLAETLDEIRRRIGSEIELVAGKFSLGCAIGVSTYPEDGTDVHALMKNADAAMYAAKRGGAPWKRFSADVGSELIRHVSLRSRLEVAIAKHVIDVAFQPVVGCSSGKLVGVEALARWSDEVLGVVPPSEFISVAEETGLIIPLGEIVLRKSLAARADWAKCGLRDEVRVSVNVSSKQLDSREFCQVVERCLSEYSLSPRHLNLEITESGMVLASSRAIDTVRELLERGCGVSIDDFGTGYSSLSQIRRLPITQLKIDRSFVATLATEASDQAIVSGVLGVARSLGVDVVAEGVETSDQMQILTALGCSSVQGFLLGRPMTSDELVAGWISESCCAERVDSSDPERSRAAPSNSGSREC